MCRAETEWTVSLLSFHFLVAEQNYDVSVPEVNVCELLEGADVRTAAQSVKAQVDV